MALNEVIALLSTVAVCAFILGRASKPDKAMRWYKRGADDAALAVSGHIDIYKNNLAAITAELDDLKLKSASAYRMGWEDSKQLYYTERLEDQRREQEYARQESERTISQINAENRTFLPITSDLLMAYGVTRVGDLPRSVRETYQIPEEFNSMDIDTMLRAEGGGINNE